MEEVAVSIAPKVSKYLVYPILREAYYLFCACKIIKNLENEKRKLTSTRDNVSQRVKEVEKKTERIEDVVQKWLQEVQNLLEKVENMEQEVKVNSCFGGLCPTWRRYHLCKQLVEKIERMTVLNDNSKFERFSCLASIPTIEYFSSGNFTFFESTKLACNQLLEALRDDGCYMIGLYGMGGCGKTTLAKEVGKIAKELNLFDKVVFTTVSQTLNVRGIQGEIADLLGLTFIEESETGRARRLSMRLQCGERILVILDDIWEILNLEDIGIPIDGNLKSCKVLLTTRLQQLCTLLDCQRNVPLGLLSEEEAWLLFQKKACLADRSSPMLLNNVAQEVAMECKGLPIAIDAVGKSLKGKSLDVWNEALDKLKHSKPLDVEKGVRDAFTCLQYSYDNLKSEEAKGLFLMCSLFPEDHEICMEDLFRYAIGLGICGEADSLDISRSRVNKGLDHLVDSSLLMHSDKSKNHFKMHDMVRDVALWISSKEDCTVMVDHAKGINSLALDGAIKNCYQVSTWYEGEDQFPQQLDAPKLEILLLNSTNLFNLSHASFEGMKRLKVMAVIFQEGFFSPSNCISLSQSGNWLTNLRALRLVCYQLGDISPVVCLSKIEILDFRGSTFNVLPNGIEKLNKLKLLDLSMCKIGDCCDDVLGTCSQLEELYPYHGEAVDGKKIIDSYKCFVENNAFLKLQRYVLQIGQIRETIASWQSSTRVLLLGELNISTLGAIIKDLLQRAEAVGLDSLHGVCKSFFPELANVVGGMNQMTKLWLRSCAEIEFLICTTPARAYCFQVDHAYPMLVELRLECMDNLKQVCNGPPPLCIFQELEKVCISHCHQLQSIFPTECNLSNLKYLSITDCPNLTSLFLISTAQTLLQLEHIELEDCCEMTHIIKNEGQNGSDTGEETLLFSESFDLVFPKLKFLAIRKCDKLEYQLPIFLAENIWLRNASELGILNCPRMTIFPREWNLSNLKILNINGFPKYASIFSISVAQTLLLLEELYVEKCKELKYIIFDEEDGTATREQTFRVSEKSSLIFPKLKILRVCACDKLKYIFPIYCAQGLLQLQRINIRRTYQMKYVFGKDVGEDLSTNQNKIQILFPQLKEFKLFNLPGLVKICSGEYYPSWPSLKLLRLLRCPKLTISRNNFNVGLELTQSHSNTGLEEVETDGVQGSNEDLAPLSSISSANVKTLEVNDCGVVNIFHLQGLVPRGRNDQQYLTALELKRLTLKNLPELRLTWTGLDLTQVVGLRYLQYIELDQCRKLKCVFPAVIHRSLPHLTRLLIHNCENLKEIFEENKELQNLSNVQECFPKLEKLEVKGCTKLKIIFSIGMVRSFPKLRTLCISEAAQLEEVFGHTSEDSSDNAKEIMLPNLIEIKLKKLPKLIDICQGFNLLAEGIDKIQIHECPKFAPISKATRYWRTKGVRAVVVNGNQLGNEAPTLPLSVLYSEELDDCGVIDIFQVDGSLSVGGYDQQLFMDSKVVRLGSKHELWTGPIPTKMLSFQYLHSLVVRRCGKLKSLFPVDVVHKSLPALVFLTICDCEEMEEIIAEENEEHQDQSSTQVSVCFPKLRELVVERCNKLKRLFPATIARTLPQLEVLCISEAAQLEEVFSCRRGDNISNNGEKILLENLGKLKLRKLPCLVRLSNKLKIPYSVELEVDDCPNSGFW